MPLQQISSTDFLSILHETRSIWSAGLKIDQYYEFNDMQRHDRWGKRNQELWGYTTKKNELAASLKLYHLTMMARGKEYPCYGIGAIFSRHKFRGRGFGGKIVEATIAKAKADGVKALMLFSDIGTEFYEKYGFYEIGTVEFTVVLDFSELDQSKLDGIDFEVKSFFEADFEILQQHHRRWLRRRPFGVSRSVDYFKYKARKENYLHLHSRLSWPMLHVLSVTGTDNSELAYAVFEIGGASIRILELVSPQSLIEKIWRAIVLAARERGLKRIKSWESNMLELSPGFSLKSFLSSTVYKQDFAPTIYYSQRSWGKVMILPLDKEILPWLNSFPSPILELDHL